MRATPWVFPHAGDNTQYGYELTQRIIDSGKLPDGIFYSADEFAAGGIRAFLDRGFSLPKDVGILCYGSSPFNAYFTPSLSSVEFPLERMIQDCVRLLLDKYATTALKRSQSVSRPPSPSGKVFGLLIKNNKENDMAYLKLKYLFQRFGNGHPGGRYPSGKVFVWEWPRPRCAGMAATLCSTCCTGGGDDHSRWGRFTSIERYVIQYGLAVVMPNALVSRYYQHGLWLAFSGLHRRGTSPDHVLHVLFLGKAGGHLYRRLSMGGTGALTIGLSQPDRFAAIGVLSAGNWWQRRCTRRTSCRWRPSKSECAPT